VAIASPSDLQKERDAIPTLFVRWNSAHEGVQLTPMMWETNSLPAAGDHPQHTINRQLIDRADLLVALFWTKIGSPVPNAPSGTIDEIREFSRLKGPQRIMIYFCTRPVAQSPDEIDSESFAALKSFKNEMRSQCLYTEFRDTAEFQRELYFHLDLKTKQLLTGQLVVPGSPEELEQIWWDKEAADPRLRQPLEFGLTLDDIASSFALRMDEFDKEEGVTINKFLKLAEHTYRSVARSIDVLLRDRSYSVNFQIWPRLRDAVSELRKLADEWESYSTRPFPELWQKGRAISNGLNDLAKRNSSLI